MTDYGLISIVLTLYNKAPYIEETIFSIYNQNYQNRELILVDDCSTDGSFEIAKSLCKKLGIEKKCKFIQNEKNLWVSKTFERGLNEAKGDWISMCDGDDILLKNHLEEKIKFCKINKYDFCCGGCIDIDENNNFLGFGNGGLFGWIHKKYLKHNTFKEHLILPNAIGSSIFFNKKIKDKLLNISFPTDVFQDFWTEIVAKIFDFKIGTIDNFLFYHRRCINSITVYKDGLLHSYKEYYKQRLSVVEYLLKKRDTGSNNKKRIQKWDLINREILGYLQGNQRKLIGIFFTIIKENIGLKHKCILLYQLLNIAIHK